MNAKLAFRSKLKRRNVIRAAALHRVGARLLAYPVSRNP